MKIIHSHAMRFLHFEKEITVCAFFLTLLTAQCLYADDCQFLRDQLTDPSIHEVIVPPGTYICSKPVIMNHSMVTLRGRGNPTLQLADHAQSPLLIMGGINDDSRGIPPPVTGLLVEGLVLNGNRANQETECWGGVCNTSGNTSIHNNTLTLRGIKNSTVRNVEVLGARSGGLVTERNCSGLLIDGLTARNNFFDGLSVNWTHDSVFENLKLSDNGYAGLTMDTKVTGNTFRDGNISQNHDVGIFLRNASGNHFEQLNVSANHSHGIYLSDTDGKAGTCADDNIFFQVNARCNGRDGFHMDAICPGNRLDNSMAANNGGKPAYGAWTISASTQLKGGPVCSSQ